MKSTCRPLAQISNRIKAEFKKNLSEKKIDYLVVKYEYGSKTIIKSVQFENYTISNKEPDNEFKFYFRVSKISL